MPAYKMGTRIRVGRTITTPDYSQADSPDHVVAYNAVGTVIGDRYDVNPGEKFHRIHQLCKMDDGSTISIPIKHLHRWNPLPQSEWDKSKELR